MCGWVWVCEGLGSARKVHEMPVSYANLDLKRLRVRSDHLVVLLLRRVGLPC